MTDGNDFKPRPWLPTAPYYVANGCDIRDVIEAFALNYNRGAVLKYIARAGRKPGNAALLDLYKAREHISREIACLEGLGTTGDAARENSAPAAALPYCGCVSLGRGEFRPPACYGGVAGSRVCRWKAIR